MRTVENTIEKTIYIVSEILIDIGLLIAFSFNLLFALIGDPDCRENAERLFKKIKDDFIK